METFINNNSINSNMHRFICIVLFAAVLLFTFGCTSDDYYILDGNSDANIDLSDYVAWIDGNQVYVKQSDGNVWYVLVDDFNNYLAPQSCDPHFALQTIGSITTCIFVPDDSNWQSGWDAFDSNMSSTYLKLDTSNDPLTNSLEIDIDASYNYLSALDLKNLYGYGFGAALTFSDENGMTISQIGGTRYGGNGLSRLDFKTREGFVTGTRLTLDSSGAYFYDLNINDVECIFLRDGIYCGNDFLDTNAETACDTNNVLLGQGTCVNISTLGGVPEWGTIIGDIHDQTDLDDYLDKIQYNIMVNTFNLQVQNDLSYLNMVDGFVDEFEDETGVNTSLSSGEDYNSALNYYTNGIYTLTATTSGGTITTSGSDRIHTFTSSGTFTTNTMLDINNLVVAGGGGGAGGYYDDAQDGGGGAGGLIYTASEIIGIGSWGVTIGSGGAGGVGAAPGVAGGDSVFNSHTAVGGGRGGTVAVGNAGNGGCGGGESEDAGYSSPGTGSQGGNGGSGTTYDSSAGGAGGGGGGMGGNGGNGSGDTGGAGGAGVSYTISGSTVWYSEGGGGAGAVTGGSTAHGGGRGSDGEENADNATTYGSGGGGAGVLDSGNTNGGAGKQGIVIIRFNPATGTAYSDLNLFSQSFIAESVPTTARIIILQEDIDATTLNSDFNAYVSRDGMNNKSLVTLSDVGDFNSSIRILAGSVDLSGQPSDTNMSYNIKTGDAKRVIIHGVGLLWD